MADFVYAGGRWRPVTGMQQANAAPANSGGFGNNNSFSTPDPVFNTGMEDQSFITPSVDSSQDNYWRDRNAREAQEAKNAATARAQAESRRVNNALASAKTFFDTYGMSELWGGVDALVRQGYNDADTISQVLSRDNTYQTAYFKRFPAVQRIREVNKQRLADGLTIMPEPSPASYVALEDGYRMALVGLPKGLWGSSQDVADWIVKDVSPEEVSSRVTTAKNYINYSTNTTIKSELRKIYGMTDQEMTAYVLDEERALGYIENEYQSRLRKSTVGASAIDAGLSLNDLQRDQLAGNDIYGKSYGNTLAGMNVVAEDSETYADLGKMSGIKTSDSELISDQFGLSGGATAASKKKKLASQERARFAGTAGVGSQSLNARPLGST